MKTISNIVFTRNRPLQLEGYLESLYRHLPAEKIQTYILYKVDRFVQEYEQLFQRYPGCRVIEEQDFFTDLLDLLSRVDTKFILFGVDDVVYFDSVRTETIEAVLERNPEEAFGFSLRLGKEMVEEGGDFVEDISISSGEKVYRLRWPAGKTPTTRYPFELCATVYRADLVRQIVDNVVSASKMARKVFGPGSALMRGVGRIIKTRRLLKSLGFFYNPNTLESWNCRWCQHHSEQLPQYLYFQKHCASAIQVNMVNTSTKNLFDGGDEYTIETLAEKYRQGYRLDIDFVSQNKPAETHCGSECFKVKIP